MEELIVKMLEADSKAPNKLRSMRKVLSLMHRNLSNNHSNTSHLTSKTNYLTIQNKKQTPPLPRLAQDISKIDSSDFESSEDEELSSRRPNEVQEEIKKE